jgi:hypothetical protein
MSRANTFQVAAVALSAGIFLSACSTMTLSPFPEPSDSSFRQVDAHPGISVFAEPILDERRSRDLFGVDLQDNGILAVYVATKSTNPDASLMFPADSVRIAKAGSGSGRLDPERGDQELGEGLSVVGAVLVSPVFLMAGAQQLSDASVIEENFERKRLRTSMVDPGEVVSGFSYFDWNQLKGTDRADVCWMLSDPVKSKAFPVCVPIRLGG